MRAIAKNITLNTIQSVYDNISSDVKKESVGVYDSIKKEARWLYKDRVLDKSQYFNRELVFNMTLSSFTISEIGETDAATGLTPYVVGYLPLSSALFIDTGLSVLAGGTGVVVSGEEVSVTLRRTNQDKESATKYISVRDLGTGSFHLGVAGYTQLDFKDWNDITNTDSSTGVDAEAILLTGYDTEGDAELIKKNPYITVFLERTESGFTDDGSGNLTPTDPSSCILQAQWDWTNSASAGRWSNEREVYRLPRPYTPTGSGDPFDYGFTVVKTKNKIRGKGSALSLLFKTNPGKNLHLYGWSREISAEKD